jgi:hypothetical protein
MAIALACDIRIAAESAIMTTGYSRIGLTGDYGIAWLLTRLAGTARARELMFLSERLDARRCEALGLVNRVVPDGELQETAFALAKSLAQGPPIALGYMKDNLDHAVTSGLLDSMDQEAENLVRAARTIDHKEAVRAFIENPSAIKSDGAMRLREASPCLSSPDNISSKWEAIGAVKQTLVNLRLGISIRSYFWPEWDSRMPFSLVSMDCVGLEKRQIGRL